MFNSVSEERYREDTGYRIFLTLPRTEYATLYEGDINESNAYDFLLNYLEHRDDDGRPCTIKIHDLKESDLFQIEAELRYEGNGHTEYSHSYGYINNKRDY